MIVVVPAVTGVIVIVPVPDVMLGFAGLTVATAVLLDVAVIAPSPL